ncbi:MAG: citrate/2-methylcitrate synthase [Acidimicrobiales bacterium]
MSDSITITDNRTGESFEIPIEDGGVDSSAWTQNLPGLWFNDPGFTTTSSCLSSITDIKGDEGILRYRGYPIEQLAKDSTYLEVSYLLLNGELPDAPQLDQWTHDVAAHSYTHENFRRHFVDSFHFNAHPMGMLMSSIAALGTFYPDAKDVEDPANRMLQTTRLVAKLPTLAAGAYRARAPGRGCGACEGGAEDDALKRAHTGALDLRSIGNDHGRPCSPSPSPSRRAPSPPSSSSSAPGEAAAGSELDEDAPAQAYDLFSQFAL